jgi:hypothetical protein
VVKPLSKSFIKPKSIKRYKSLDALIGSFFGCKIKNLSEYTLGCQDTDSGETVQVSYDDFKSSIEETGSWGYCNLNDKTIKVWHKEDSSLESLISFIAHEVGHLNGKQYKNVLKDEIKAVNYEDVAVYAYRVASKMVKKGK